MGSIKHYCFSVILISVSAGIALFITPNNQRIKKYVNLICGLCLLLFIASPVKELLSTDISFPEISIDGEEWSGDDRYEEMVIDDLKNRISEDIAVSVYNRFNVKCDSCSIVIDSTEAEAISIEEITVYTETKSDFLIREIKDFIGSEYSCKISVLKKEGD